MFPFLQNRLKKAAQWLPLALLPFAAHAQLGYTPANAVNVAGTFTALGTTGTVIATANTDDANSAAQPIGFAFTYNGASFTQFVLSTNGLIRLGAAAPSATNLFFTTNFSTVGPLNSTNAADVNLLMPFSADLTSGTSPAEYRVSTTGTGTSHVCTIQWANVSDKEANRPTQYSNFTFQVKLYEGSNNIEFVYGPATASSNANTDCFATVGIMGSNGNNSVVGISDFYNVAWNIISFIVGPYIMDDYRFTNVEKPDIGRTYRFVSTASIGRDVAVSTVFALTKIPIPQASPHVVRAVVTNNGGTTQTNVPVTLTATGANAFANTQTIASLAPGAAVTVSFAAYASTAGGNSTLTVTVPADDNNTNNSRSMVQVANASTFSYCDASAPITGIGFGGTSGDTHAFLAAYTVGVSTSVTQVRAYLVDFEGMGPGSTIGKTVYGVVVNPATGAVLGRSADFIVTAASLNAYTTFTLNTPVTIASGTFLAGMAQTYQTPQAERYFPIGTQPEFFGCSGTSYTSAITPSPTIPLDKGISSGSRFMLEAVTVPTAALPCAAVTNLTAGTVTQTGATLAFTAAPGASSYVVTYSANGGPVTTLTPAPSASPVVLTGLMPNTPYDVSIASSCGAGQASPPVIATFTTALPTPAFAALPYTEAFDGLWVNLAAMRDVPSKANNWRNTPATNNNSWRRNDDGAAANWYSNWGGYQPASTTSLHSARFHSYNAANTSMGALDLYVNLSGASAKMLQFDYLNIDGTDRLDVLISTDGGSTFAPAPAASFTTSPFWANQTVALASTSATTVIRFQATSDFGFTDLGLDNVRVSVVTAVRDEALAARVDLYPNPAHQSVTLQVPAGNLHNATATLFNALGQMVLTRQLSLPAAGGSATFDLSNLAAGVYSLRLQAGNDLVFKRLVVDK